MKFHCYLAAATLASMLPFATQAEEIIVQTSEEERLVIQVDESDSFLAILKQIQDQFKSQEEEFFSYATLDNTEEITLAISFLDKITVSKSKAKDPNRNYFLPLKQKERDDVGYILRTLSNHTFVTLAPYRSSLKKAGDRVNHLHPFRFLECIFTNEELKACVKSIQGKAFVWGEFLKGITTSLKEEKKKNNLPPEYLVDFSSIVGIDFNILYPSYVNQQWEEMVNILIDVVPRSDGSNRYNI